MGDDSSSVSLIRQDRTGSNQSRPWSKRLPIVAKSLMLVMVLQGLLPQNPHNLKQSRDGQTINPIIAIPEMFSERNIPY